MNYSPIVPAILGKWEAGQIICVDRNTLHMHVCHSFVLPDMNDSTVMPIGQCLEFTIGYDKASDANYWKLSWLPYFSLNAYQHSFFESYCIEIDDVIELRQMPITLEFHMNISYEKNNYFFPVGSLETGNVYHINCGNNTEWSAEFYVSKDRQTMWSFVSINDYQNYYGLQEYHRVAEYVR